jgi:hypothetical protein
MGKRDGRQPGPQQHAEGQHGERTHARFLEQIHQPMERGDTMAVQAGADEPGTEVLEPMRSRDEKPAQDDDDASGTESGRNRKRR